MRPDKLEDRFIAMKQMKDDGMTITQIGDHYGISRQRVSQVFHEHGYYLRETIPDEVIHTIADPVKIAEKFNVLPVSMKARMKRMGYWFARKPFPTGENRKPYPVKVWTKERVAEMYTDYKNGMTTYEVANKHGTYQPLVSKLFKKHGYKTTYRNK